MEVQRGLGDMVEAVGGRGHSRARFYHQTHSTSCQAATNHRVVERGGAIHAEPREQTLQPHPHPRTVPCAKDRTTRRRARAQWLGPVVRAQRRGPGLTWGSQDACWVGDRREQGVGVTGLRVVGRLWEAEGAGRRERRTGSWIGLDR